MRIGPYEVLGELGRGGMGVVYRARRADLGREYALKVLAPGAGSPAWLARFRREAQAAARLAGHPNIVAVHDVGEGLVASDAASPVLYLAMDLIAGRSFSDVIAEGELTPAQAAEIVETIARALAHAHANGVLHRDVKPGNILIGLRASAAAASTRMAAANGPDPAAVAEGEPCAYLTDFGLARSETAGPELTRLTHSGEVVGTPAYMSPEQARGEPVDARTDIYALGATLYEALAGVPPFDGPSATSVLMRVLREAPPPLRQVAPHVPRAYETITTRCLAKLPADRYPTAEALAEDLARARRGDAVEVVGPSAGRRLLAGLGRHRAAVALAGLLAAAGVAIPVAWHRSVRAGEQALRETGTQLDAAELGTRLSAAYYVLVRDTTEPMRVLQDAWYGAPVAPEARAAALAAVRAACDTVAATEPALRLPAAWGAFARFYDRQREPALAELRTLAAADGGDPFPAVLHARALLAEYMATSGLTELAVSEGQAAASRLSESPERLAMRRTAGALLRDVAARPVFVHLRQGREVLALVRAVAAFADGEFTAAADALAPLADDPILGPEATFLRGTCITAVGDPADAAPLLAAIGRGWRNPAAQASMAWLVAAQRQGARGEDPRPRIREAIRVLAPLATSLPGEASLQELLGGAWWTLAMAEEARGVDPESAFADAERAYRAAIALEPTNGGFLSNLGTALQRRGRAARQWGRDPFPHLAAAFEVLDRAVAAHPEMQWGWLNRAATHWERGTASEGIGQDPRPSLRAALADLDVAERLAPDDPEPYRYRGNVLVALGDAELERQGDAVTPLRTAVEAYARARERGANDYLTRYDEGRAARALAEAQAAVHEDPRPAVAAAEASFAAVIAMNPAYAPAYIERARLRWLAAVRGEGEWAGQIAAAEGDVAEGLRHNPVHPGAWTLLVDVARARVAREGPGDLGPLEAALGVADAALSAGAPPARAHRARARLCYEWGYRSAEIGGEAESLLAKALAAYDAACLAEPGDVEARLDRARCRRQRAALHPAGSGEGNAELEAALADCAAAVAQAPGLRRAHVVHGLVLGSAGRDAESVAAYETALRITPGDPEATRLLAEARRHAAARGR